MKLKYFALLIVLTSLVGCANRPIYGRKFYGRTIKTSDNENLGSKESRHHEKVDKCTELDSTSAELFIGDSVSQTTKPEIIGEAGSEKVLKLPKKAENRLTERIIHLTKSLTPAVIGMKPRTSDSLLADDELPRVKKVEPLSILMFFISLIVIAFAVLAVPIYLKFYFDTFIAWAIVAFALAAFVVILSFFKLSRVDKRPLSGWSKFFYVFSLVIGLMYAAIFLISVVIKQIADQ